MAESLILYSFRRCPYAIRARMTLHYSNIRYEHREVLLKDKPPELLAISPKATVPVLHAARYGSGADAETGAGEADALLLEESLEIMRWALARHDPDGWLQCDPGRWVVLQDLVAATESTLKPNLDRFKYNHDPDAEEALVARSACGDFVVILEQQLGAADFLHGGRLGFADVAVLPFIRQLANVDPEWFAGLRCPGVQRWLAGLLDAPVFLDVMAKHPRWMGSSPR